MTLTRLLALLTPEQRARYETVICWAAFDGDKAKLAELILYEDSLLPKAKA